MDQLNAPTNPNMAMRQPQMPGGAYNDPRVLIPGMRTNYPMMNPYLGYPEQVEKRK